jgi:hypothetical protein
MKKVRFKDYVGLSNQGCLANFDCSDFNDADLIEMLKAPLSLRRVNFQTGHAIWSDYIAELFNSDIDECIKWGNLGFAKTLASLGYRVVPDADEFIKPISKKW